MILEAVGAAGAVAAQSVGSWSMHRTWVVGPPHPLLGTVTSTPETVYITVGTGSVVRCMLQGLLVHGTPWLAPCVVLEMFAACLHSLTGGQLVNDLVLTHVDYPSLVAVTQNTVRVVCCIACTSCTPSNTLQRLVCGVDPVQGHMSLLADGTSCAYAAAIQAPCGSNASLCILPPMALVPSPPRAVSMPCPEHNNGLLSHTPFIEAMLQLGAMLAPAGTATLPLMCSADAMCLQQGVPAWHNHGGPLLQGVVLTAPWPTSRGPSLTPTRPVPTIRQTLQLPMHHSSDSLENVVAQLVAELVGAPVAPDVPLLAAGLDSLAAVELPSQLSARYGVSLDATLVIDHPTIQAMVQYIHQRLTAAAEAPSVLLRPAVQANGRPVAIFRSAGVFLYLNMLLLLLLRK